MSKRRRERLSKRIAAWNEELNAVEEQLISTLNADERVKLKRRSDTILKAIEDEESKLNELDAADPNRNIRDRNLESSLSKIDFDRAKKIARSVKKKLSGNGGSVLFFMQDSKIRCGNYCIKEVLYELMSEQVVDGEIRGNYQHYPVNLDSAASQSDRLEVLTGIARHLEIELGEGSNLQALLQEIATKIASSLSARKITIFVEIAGMDDLLDADDFFTWFFKDFWNPLIERVKTTSMQYKSRLIVALIADSKVLPKSPELFSCNLRNFKSDKLLELPLSNWKIKDIENWLEYFRPRGLADDEIDAIAERIYRGSNKGTPENVCLRLREEFQQ